MNYELAKKLKKAGFPFIEIMGGMPSGINGYFDFNPKGLQSLGAQHFYNPTLSELIRECDCNLHLERNPRFDEDDWWEALDDITMIKTAGETPEIAVANLWLELNKKNE